MTDDVKKRMQRAAEARRDGRSADAEPDLLAAVASLRADGTPVELAVALQALGQIERDLKRPADALAHYEEAVALLRGVGEPLRLAHAVRHVADIHRNLGDVERADPCYAEALAIYRADPQTAPLDLANTLRGYALNSGDAPGAVALWTEAKSLYESVGVEAGVEECVQRIARAAR